MELSTQNQMGSQQLKNDKTNLQPSIVPAKFSQMIEELAVVYKIPHYGELGKNLKYEVNQPALTNGKYVTYNIKGEDALGQFEGKRRYNDFYALRNIIMIRWPGVFLP